MNTKVEWIILISDHYEATKAFYRDTLGFTIVRDVSEDHFTQFQLQDGYLAIYGRKEIEALLGRPVQITGGGAIYSFAEVENVDELYRHLKSKGVQFIKPPQTQTWGQRTAYFTDPDGHIWEIQQWIKD